MEVDSGLSIFDLIIDDAAGGRCRGMNDLGGKGRPLTGSSRNLVQMRGKERARPPLIVVDRKGGILRARCSN